MNVITCDSLENHAQITNALTQNIHSSNKLGDKTK